MDFWKTEIKINTSCEKWVSDTIPSTSFGSKKNLQANFEAVHFQFFGATISSWRFDTSGNDGNSGGKT